MAHRFLSYTPKGGRILKNGLFNGKFLEVEPKTDEAGQSKKFLSQSSGPKEDNKDATDVGENGAADENIEMEQDNESSSPPTSSSATKDPNQDQGNTTSAGPNWDHVDPTQVYAAVNECAIM